MNLRPADASEGRRPISNQEFHERIHAGTTRAAVTAAIRRICHLDSYEAQIKIPIGQTTRPLARGLVRPQRLAGGNQVIVTSCQFPESLREITDRREEALATAAKFVLAYQVVIDAMITASRRAVYSPVAPGAQTLDPELWQHAEARYVLPHRAAGCIALRDSGLTLPAAEGNMPLHYAGLMNPLQPQECRLLHEVVQYNK